MKLMKRGFAAIAGTMCIVSMALTGCGGSSSDAANTTAPASTDAAATTTAPAEEGTVDTSTPVELSWYFVGNQQQEDTEKIEQAVNDYIAQNTDLNCTIKLQCYDWGSYNDKITQMIAAQEEFDICFTANWSNNYYQQAPKGAFVELNDLLPKYAPKTLELLGEDFLSGSAINGKNYAIPANKEKAHAWGLLVRTDLAEKYNMDFSNVKTLADMEPFFQTIKDNEPSIYALEATSRESAMRILDFDTLNGDTCPGVVYNDTQDYKVFNQLTAPETKEHFELMHKFYEAGYIREDAATVEDYTADQKAGLMFAAVRSLKPGKDAEESNAMGQPYTQIDLTSPVMSNRETTGSMQAISATSKNPERALMFLELFNTDPVLNNIINFGIEGDHYEVVKDNGDGSKIIKAGANQTKYNPGLGWAFGNQFINYLMDNEDPEKWTKFKEFNDASTPTQTLGFAFDQTGVQSEVAQCTNVWNEYVPGLQVGSSDPATMLDQAVEDLNAAGAETIMAEMQTQLDAWVAANK